MKVLILFLTIGVCWGLDATNIIKVKTRAKNNKIAVFHYRVPKNYDKKSRELYRVLIIFGGRNTNGRADASGRMGFAKWCDEQGIFIVSPGFRDDNYWEPQDWSGRALKSALIQLRKHYRICTDKLLFYGYSAGGQCVALFYDWLDANVIAWGLVTCGINDHPRLQISRNFIYKYREARGKLLWKIFPYGHELNQESLKLARLFFDVILSKQPIKNYGEDDTLKIHNNIDIEFHNPIHNEKIKRLWQI